MIFVLVCKCVSVCLFLWFFAVDKYRRLVNFSISKLDFSPELVNLYPIQIQIDPLRYACVVVFGACSRHTHTQNSRLNHKCSNLSFDRPTMQTTLAVMRKNKSKISEWSNKNFNFFSVLISVVLLVAIYQCHFFSFHFIFNFIDCHGIHRAFSWIDIWPFSYLAVQAILRLEFDLCFASFLTVHLSQLTFASQTFRWLR